MSAHTLYGQEELIFHFVSISMLHERQLQRYYSMHYYTGEPEEMELVFDRLRALDETIKREQETRH